MPDNIKLSEGVCHYCGCRIVWRRSKQGKRYPAELEGTKPHTCDPKYKAAPWRAGQE